MISLSKILNPEPRIEVVVVPHRQPVSDLTGGLIYFYNAQPAEHVVYDSKRK